MAQVRGRIGGRLTKEFAGRQSLYVPDQTNNPKFVGQCTDGRKCRLKHAERLREGAEELHPQLARWGFVMYGRARPKSLEIKGGVVQQALCFGVGGEQNLKAAIEPKSIDKIGLNPSAHPVLTVEQQHRPALLVEVIGAGKTGHTGTDDYNWHT